MVLVLAVVITVIFSIAAWGSSASCKSSWAQSGFQTQWGPVKGCLISKDGGKTWIPSKNYREIP